MKSQVRLWASKITAKSWIWDDVHSVGGVNHLNSLLQGIVPSASQSMYGSHFIFNNQSNTNLGHDGYDNYQAPMSPSGTPLFQRRMWVSGFLQYFGDGPKVNDLIRCMETVDSVRSIGDSVFVTIGRKFTKIEGNRPVMEEIRTLMYTNELYKSPSIAASSAETDSFPSAVASHKFMLSLSDVMRFCSLSYNLHKIHYDLQYCQEEHLANVIAPGPFLVQLMLRFFQLVCPEAKIKTFKYRNSEPCYIDQDLHLHVVRDAANYEVFVSKDGRKLCGGHLVVY